MELEEWESLTAGSVVSNNKGKNHRVVLSYNTKTRGMKLVSSSDRGRKGYTVYCVGDRAMFKLVKVRVVNCKNNDSTNNTK